MDYRHKYYKYKSKYLNFLKQNGGSDVICKQKVLSFPLKNESNHDDPLEIQTKNFIDSLKNSTPIYKLEPGEARKVLNKIQSDESYKSIVDTEDLDINIENESISITIFRPKNSDDTLNAMMYFHGGGWILGNKQTHGRLVSELAVGANIAVVFVNYTPAPEGKYPIQLIQCYLATKYISMNGEKHNIDATRLIVAGDSVGGNMATVVTMLDKNSSKPKISYQILLYPVTDASMSTESYNTYKDGPWLSRAGMEWFFDAYEPDKNKRSDITISPLNATIDQLKNLPPGLIITDNNDVLRDEGELYAQKLTQAGVKITAIRYYGTTHDFLMLDPLKDTPAAVCAKKLIIDHIKQILNTK